MRCSEIRKGECHAPSPSLISRRLFQHICLMRKSPPHPLIDLVISPARRCLQSCQPLAQIEQFFVPLAQEAQVLIYYIRCERANAVSHKRLYQIY